MLSKIDKKWYYLPLITILSAILVLQPVIANANQYEVEKKESKESTESLTATAVFFCSTRRRSIFRCEVLCSTQK